MKQLFLTSEANEVMDDLILRLARKPSDYNLAFIPTAAEAETGNLWWLKADKDKLLEVGFNVDEFSITGLKENQIEKKLKGKDIIFVSGGNTFYLLDQTIKSGFDKVLKRKIENGTIYIGSSAGSMLVGKGIDIVKTIDDPSKAPGLKSNGLRIIDLSILPHWGSVDFRNGYRKSFETMYSENYKVIPLTNKQYLWYLNDKYRIVQL